MTIAEEGRFRQFCVVKHELSDGKIETTIAHKTVGWYRRASTLVPA
jgi:hypothetical protein